MRKIDVIGICFGALIAVFLLVSCTDEQTEVAVEVTVKTNQGDPVADAVVSVDGKPLGETGNTGIFQTQLLLPTGKTIRIEVNKESETYYFAPYFETFVLQDKVGQNLQVEAILYFVPKPKPQGDLNETVAEKIDKVGSEKLAAVPDSATVDVQEGIDGGKPARADGSKEDGMEIVDGEKKATSEALVNHPSQEGAPSDQSHLASTAPEPSPAVGAQDVGTESDSSDDMSEVTGDPQDGELAAQPHGKHPVILSQIPVTHDGPGVPLEKAYPKPERDNEGDMVFSVLVFSGEKPLGGAEVFLGREENGDLKKACMTNERGRCPIRFDEPSVSPVTFVVKKNGYKTASISYRVKDKGRLRINLEQGQTIDIFAIAKSYNYTVGLEGVEVIVNGKRVGATDRFGRFSYVYTGVPEELLPIALKSDRYLPETFETDFVVSGPMTLVRYFAPKDPPAVRMTLLKLQPAGTLKEKDMKAFKGSVDRHLRTAAIKHLFASSAFQNYSWALFNRKARSAGRSLGEMMGSGWQDTDLKGQVDALLLPTILMGRRPVLELSVIDSKGRVLAAAKEVLDDVNDKASIERAVKVMADKITRSFPFEGSVLKKVGDQVVLNLGYSSGRGVKPGDVLDVYGVQTDKLGRSQLHGQIATLTIREVYDKTSKADVASLEPRATINRGDLVVLRPRRVPENQSAQIRVRGNSQGASNGPLAQANVYFNDHWIGSTDEDGRLYVDVTGHGTLKVIKHGFRPFGKTMTLGKASKVNVSLRRETAFVRLESEPPGAEVRIEGKTIGKTPLSAPIPVPTGFIKVDVVGPAGYKTYQTVLELDEGTLDLTGPQAIKLEQDFMATARRLLKEGQVEEAAEKMEAVPKGHSDYLLSRHELGEIYLTMLDRPADAARAFGEVTKDPGVMQFSDKRFIGSHINEGIALFMTAEKLAGSEPEAALAHYQKAIEVLDRVSPQLRFVPEDQYAQAVHNVDFHRALSRHKIWLASKDLTQLSLTVKSWTHYLDGSARNLPLEGPGSSYMENARVYLKQATASLASRKDVSAQ